MLSRKIILLSVAPAACCPAALYFRVGAQTAVGTPRGTGYVDAGRRGVEIGVSGRHRDEPRPWKATRAGEEGLRRSGCRTSFRPHLQRSVTLRNHRRRD